MDRKQTPHVPRPAAVHSQLARRADIHSCSDLRDSSHPDQQCPWQGTAVDSNQAPQGPLGTDDWRPFVRASGRRYSFWSARARNRAPNRGLRLDYVLASPAAAASVCDAFVLDDVVGSDHCPVGVDLAWPPAEADASGRL